MTTNKELVRQLAEKMAKVHRGRALKDAHKYFDDPESELPDMESYIRMHTPSAEMAVEFGAKMLEEGFREGVFHHASLGAPHMKFAFDNFLNEAKQERGLIAEKEGDDEIARS